MDIALIIFGSGMGTILLALGLSKFVPFISQKLTERRFAKQQKKQKQLDLWNSLRQERLKREGEQSRTIGQEQTLDQETKKEARRRLKKEQKARKQEKKDQKKLEKAAKKFATQKAIKPNYKNQDKTVGARIKRGAKRAKEFTQDTIERAKQNHKVQVIKQPMQHMPSPQVNYYENIISAKEDRISSLQAKGRLSSKEKEELNRLQNEVSIYRGVNAKPTEPTVIIREKEEKQPIPTITESHEQVFETLDQKTARINELGNKSRDKKEEKEFKALQKDVGKILSGNPGLEEAWFAREVQGKKEQIISQNTPIAPSQQERMNEAEMEEAAEKFAKENPKYAKYMEKFMGKNKKNN